MIRLFIFMAMLFLHIVDDYYLQGLLAKYKQKSWWEANCPDKMYKYDYMIALILHAFSWTFMIMLPIAWLAHFRINMLFTLIFVINICIHAFIDNLKANKLSINLIQDQLVHILQICITAWLLIS